MAWLHCYFGKFILDVYLAENCVWSKRNFHNCLSEISGPGGFYWVYFIRVLEIVIHLNNIYIYLFLKFLFDFY